MSHNLLPEEALYFIQQYTPLEILDGKYTFSFT